MFSSQDLWRESCLSRQTATNEVKDRKPVVAGVESGPENSKSKTIIFYQTSKYIIHKSNFLTYKYKHYIKFVPYNNN